MKLATFAAGCFWGSEESYRTLKGVILTRVGYMERAEVVEVTYDPAQISYEQLLEVFWHSHNPTIANPGGLERSAIFYHDAEQKAAIEKSKGTVQANFQKAIATEIALASEFYLADEHHQQYLLKHGLATCEVETQTSAS
jgi:peptide-methionine (S)-S-oxide reductase